MVLIVEFEDVFAAEGGSHLRMLLLVAEDVLGGGLTAGFFVVGGTNEVAGVAFADELGTKTASIAGNIVDMSVNCGKDLAAVRLPRLILFHDDFADIGAGSGVRRRTLSSVHTGLLELCEKMSYPSFSPCTQAASFWCSVRSQNGPAAHRAATAIFHGSRC